MELELTLSEHPHSPICYEMKVHGLRAEVRAVQGSERKMWRVALRLDGQMVTIGYIAREWQELAPQEIWSWTDTDRLCSFSLKELVHVVVSRYLADFWSKNYRKVTA